ncbi:MAG: ARPP-1 family domain-containing protein [Candidatus Dormibacteria bacterium]
MNEKSSNPQDPKSPTIALKERIRLDGPAGLTVGRGRSIGALTLVPVFHEGPAADYIPYASIQGSGLLEISEVTGGGQVNTLVAENRADQAVLLLEGEMLEGMQQTRVLNVTVLVPAKTTLNIPVSCVEAGRWHHDGVAASKHEFHMSPRARSRKTITVNEQARGVGSYASNQGEVWASVDDELAAHQVAAPTRAQSEIGRARGAEVRRDLDQLEPRPGQAGVVAVVGGTPLCFDLFDRPSTLEVVWKGLVGSYALDAMTVPKRAAAERDTTEARRWLSGMTEAMATEHPGVGIGTNVLLSSAGVGATSLVIDDAVVHLAAFMATETIGFARPSRRGGTQLI